MAASPSSRPKSLTPLLLLLVVSLFQQINSAATTTTTKYLLLVAKDTARLKYYTSYIVGTPPVRQYVTLDIANQYNWFNGNLTGYLNSSTYHVIPCYKEGCNAYSGKLAACFDCSCDDCSGHQPPSPTCSLNQCAALINTPPSSTAYLGPMVEDVITFYKFNPGSSSLARATYDRFPFGLTNSIGPFKGLSQYTKGVLTLSASPISIHNQLAKAFKIPRKFALCLPSSSSGLNGAVYFGGGPYILPPSKTDLSGFLVSTKIVFNTHSVIPAYDLFDPSFEYYVDIKSIKIDGSPVSFNKSLLGVDKRGDGGSKLSTLVHYTTLHSEIYKPFVEAFTLKAKALNIATVSPVSPFCACFSSKTIHYDSKTGRGLPVIDLVMRGGKSNPWSIYGSNSVVTVSEEVKCLAVVDAGPRPPMTGQPNVVASIVVGGKQLEDNLVEFDLDASKVGITSSLLKLGTSCSQFKGL